MQVEQGKGREYWFGVMFNAIGQSKYQLERAFNKLSADKRRLVLRAGGVGREDLLWGDGSEFRQFSIAGRIKIWRGVELLKSLANELPTVDRRDAVKVDETLSEVGNAEI